MKEQLECMELCLGMDEESAEISLWIRIKERTGKGDMVDDCCRPPDQEEQVDQAICRQIGAASSLQALVLMGDFNFPNI